MNDAKHENKEVGRSYNNFLHIQETLLPWPTRPRIHMALADTKLALRYGTMPPGYLDEVYTQVADLYII